METEFQIGDRVEYWRTGGGTVRQKYRGTVTGWDSSTCLAVRADNGKSHHVPLNVDDVVIRVLEADTREDEDAESAACDCCTGEGRALTHGRCAPCMNDCRGDQGCDHMVQALRENVTAHIREHGCSASLLSTCSVADRLRLKLQRELAL